MKKGTVVYFRAAEKNYPNIAIILEDLMPDLNIIGHNDCLCYYPGAKLRDKIDVFNTAGIMNLKRKIY